MLRLQFREQQAMVIATIMDSVHFFQARVAGDLVVYSEAQAGTDEFHCHQLSARQ